MVKRGRSERSFRIDVIARREDSDTPYVILQGPAGTPPIYLADVQALELIDRLGKALAILPTSK